MFKSHKDAQQRLERLREAFAELELRNRELIAASEAIKKRAFLFAIERDGRLNKFTFIRDGLFVTIETMGMLGDNVPGWKRELLE